MSIEVGLEDFIVEVTVPTIEVSVDVVSPVVDVSLGSNEVTVEVKEHTLDVSLSVGSEGTTVLHGDGTPDPSLGIEGNYYLDETNDILFGPKTVSAWPIAMDPPAEVAEHEAKLDPHPQYLDATHEAAVDPHPQYLDATHEAAVDPHPQYLKTVPVYTHTQGVLSKVWSIRHNLGKHPIVIVEDGGGSIIIGTVTYVDNNQLTVTFAFNATGHAHCT